jgi:hypothetical protein
MTHMLFPSQRREKQGDPAGIVQNPLLPERRRLLQAAIIDCIVKDGRAFNDFDREGMKNFLSCALPGFKPRHRSTIRRRLSGLYAEYRHSLRQVLPDLRWIALTTDIWLSPRRIHYICLTGHTFTPDFETVSIVLGFRRFVGQHLAQNITTYIEYELDRLGIDKACLSAITTDNGANVKAATSTKFGQRIACFAHNLHLLVTKGLCLWRKPDPEK